jgi:hypothetical protein
MTDNRLTVCVQVQLQHRWRPCERLRLGLPARHGCAGRRPACLGPCCLWCVTVLARRVWFSLSNNGCVLWFLAAPASQGAWGQQPPAPHSQTPPAQGGTAPMMPVSRAENVGLQVIGCVQAGVSSRRRKPRWASSRRLRAVGVSSSSLQWLSRRRKPRWASSRRLRVVGASSSSSSTLRWLRWPKVNRRVVSSRQLRAVGVSSSSSRLRWRRASSPLSVRLPLLRVVGASRQRRPMPRSSSNQARLGSRVRCVSALLVVQREVSD